MDHQPAWSSIRVPGSRGGPSPLASWPVIQTWPSWPVSATRQRPGIVHRLDRGTSGLLVVARTERRLPGIGGPAGCPHGCSGGTWRWSPATCPRAGGWWRLLSGVRSVRRPVWPSRPKGGTPGPATPCYVATRCCLVSMSRSRPPCCCWHSTPAGPIRSGCVLPPSAIRWWATTAMAGPAGAARCWSRVDCLCTPPNSASCRQVPACPSRGRPRYQPTWLTWSGKIPVPLELLSFRGAAPLAGRLHGQVGADHVDVRRRAGRAPPRWARRTRRTPTPSRSAVACSEAGMPPPNPKRRRRTSRWRPGRRLDRLADPFEHAVLVDVGDPVLIVRRYQVAQGGGRVGRCPLVEAGGQRRATPLSDWRSSKVMPVASVSFLLGRTPSQAWPASSAVTASSRCSRSPTSNGIRIVRPCCWTARSRGSTDPPGGVGREAEAPSPIELFDEPRRRPKVPSWTRSAMSTPRSW